MCSDGLDEFFDDVVETVVVVVDEVVVEDEVDVGDAVVVDDDVMIDVTAVDDSGGGTVRLAAGATLGLTTIALTAASMAAHRNCRLRRIRI